MATPNYSYEKRQREIAKKKKKEEKLRQKSAQKEGESNDTADTGSTENPVAADDAPAAE